MVEQPSLETKLTALIEMAREHGSLTRDVVSRSTAADNPIVQTSAIRAGRDAVDVLLALVIDAANKLAPRTPTQRTDLAIRAALNLLPDVVPGTNSARRLKALSEIQGVDLRTVQRWAKLGATQLVRQILQTLDAEGGAVPSLPGGSAIADDVPPYHVRDCRYEVYLGPASTVVQVVRRLRIVPQQRAMDYFKVSTSYRGTDSNRHYTPITYVSFGHVEESPESPGISFIRFDPPRPEGVEFLLEITRDYNGVPPNAEAAYVSLKHIDRLTFELHWIAHAGPSTVWHYQDIFAGTDTPDFDPNRAIPLIPDQNFVRWPRPDPPKPGLVTGIKWAFES